MERFLLVYRGDPEGAADSHPHDSARWERWFQLLGSRLLDRGSLSQGSVDVDTRLAGPKVSSSLIAGYSILAATDFNEAVTLTEQCPIFDEHGSLQIAHL